MLAGTRIENHSETATIILTVTAPHQRQRMCAFLVKCLHFAVNMSLKCTFVAFVGNCICCFIALM